MDIEICWIPSHIGIEGNEAADRAAKEAVTKTKAKIKIPVSDYMPAIRNWIFSRWQSSWCDEPDTNKLKQIKPNVGVWQSSFQGDRRTEVVLSRLRIGHTHLTHGYLMSTPRDTFPECTTCRTHLTIRHIFDDCQGFRRLRIAIFGNRTFKDILSDSNTFSAASVMKFLKQCKFLDKI